MSQSNLSLLSQTNLPILPERPLSSRSTSIHSHSTIGHDHIATTNSTNLFNQINGLHKGQYSQNGKTSKFHNGNNSHLEYTTISDDWKQFRLVAEIMINDCILNTPTGKYDQFHMIQRLFNQSLSPKSDNSSKSGKLRHLFIDCIASLLSINQKLNSQSFSINSKTPLSPDIISKAIKGELSKIQQNYHPQDKTLCSEKILNLDKMVEKMLSELIIWNSFEMSKR
jgi:hypothetical protein